MIILVRQFLWGMTVVFEKKNKIKYEGSLNAKK